VDKEKMDALIALKELNAQDLIVKKQEILDLTKKVKTQEIELKEHQKMLRNALHQRKELDDMEAKKDNVDIKETLELIKAATVGRTTEQDYRNAEALEKKVAELADIITDGRSRLAKRAEVQRSLFCEFEDIPINSPVASRRPSPKNEPVKGQSIISRFSLPFRSTANRTK
jgi:hypothetical protein